MPSANPEPIYGEISTRKLAGLTCFFLGLATFTYAGVHPEIRAWLALLAASLAVLANLRSLVELPPVLRLQTWGVMALAVLGALPLLLPPASLSWRAPGLSELLSELPQVLGVPLLDGSLVRSQASESLAILASFLALALCAAPHASQRHSHSKQARVCVAVGLLCCLMSWSQRALGLETIGGLGGIPLLQQSHAFGPFINPNHGALFCAALMPLAWKGWQRSKGLRLLWTVILGLGVLSCGSRGAIPAAAGGMLITAWLSGQRSITVGAAWLLGPALVLTLMAGPLASLELYSSLIAGSPEGSDLTGQRLQVWGESLAVWWELAPLLGAGLGSYEEIYAVGRTIPTFAAIQHAHNEGVQVLVELGALGLIAWGLILIPTLGACLRRCQDERNRSRRNRISAWCGAGAVLLLGSLYTFPFRTGALAALGVIVLFNLWGFLLRAAGESPPSSRLQRLPQLLLVLFSLGIAASHWAQVYLPGSPPEESLEHRVAREPLSHRGWLQLSDQRLKEGQRAEALQALTFASLVDPMLPWSWVHQARLLDSSESQDAILQAWHGALRSDGPDPETMSEWLTEALSSQPLSEESLLVMLPERVDRNREAAQILARQGETELAERLFQRVRSLDPQAVASYARFLLRERRAEEALALAEFIAEDCSRYPVIAEATLRQKRYPQAEEAYREALSLCPSQTRYWVGLAQAQLAQDNLDGERILQRLLEESPDLLGVRRQLLSSLRGRPGTQKERLVHLEALLLQDDLSQAELEELAALGRLARP